MSKKYATKSLLALAGKFIEKQAGTWDHAAWEGLVEEASALGYAMDAEGRRALGQLLEGARHFQMQQPGVPEGKKKEKKPKLKVKVEVDGEDQERDVKSKKKTKAFRL